MTTPNRQEPTRLLTGITVVGKRAVIPRGVRIGRNVKIGGDVRTSDFATRVVKTGATVERHEGGTHRHGGSMNGRERSSTAQGSGTSAVGGGSVGPSPIRQTAEGPAGGSHRPD